MDREKGASPVEIITEDRMDPAEEPLVTIRTGQFDGKKFFVRLNQPQGRALLVALHL